ncbi:MAG: hypothetical protein IJ748_00285, partial [Bacteroidales bacterium]|nr:hypothetical protein [Bacteroidales bacterium]
KDNKAYEFKIFRTKIFDTSKNKETGTLWIENKKKILVQAEDCVIELSDLQLSGKKRMPAEELTKGLRTEFLKSSIKE